MSSPTLPDPMPQLHANVAAIVAEVEQITGLKSRWSGRVVIGTDVDASGLPLYLGAKPWNCDITLHQRLLALLSRYSTLLYEVFHSVSVGLTKSDYDVFEDYEEGVVEQCTRLFRADILARAGLPAPTVPRTSYRSKVALLEALRLRAQQTPQSFYLELLKTPLRDREARILQWIQNIESTKTRPQIEQETASLRIGLKS